MASLILSLRTPLYGLMDYIIYDISFTYIDVDFLPRPLATFLTPPPKVRADPFNGMLYGFCCAVLVSSSLGASSIGYHHGNQHHNNNTYYYQHHQHCCHGYCWWVEPLSPLLLFL